jgi:anti-sigma factor ChrR (cupin superfamily)
MNQGAGEHTMLHQAMLYALGTLTQNETRAFEEHRASGCAECETELRATEAVVTRLAFNTVDLEPPAAVGERLAAYAAQTKIETAKAPAHKTDLPQRASVRPELTSVRMTEGDWFESSRGVFVKRLFVNETTRTITSLVKMMPGAHGTVHRHPGIEECVVIEGDFHVAGYDLGAGDYHVAAAGSIHDSPYTVGGALLLIFGPPYELL